MSQLVDELLGTADHVQNILNNNQEYSNAMARINEIIASRGSTDEQKVKAKTLGIALKMSKSRHTDPIAYLKDLIVESAARTASGEDAVEDHAETMLSFGMTVFFKEHSDNITSIIEARVIGADNEFVCLAIREGTVHFLPRELVFSNYETAALS